MGKTGKPSNRNRPKQLEAVEEAGGKMNAKRSLKGALASLGIAAAVVAAFMIPDIARAADTGWQGEYYNNLWLAGSPALVRTDTNIDFDWGMGSPDPSISADDFSVRWTRTVNLESGDYRFTTETDDGVRLYVDGILIIDEWYDQAPTIHTADLNLSAGDHSLRMEYYENGGGAVARLSWEPIQSTHVGNLLTCVRPTDSWLKVYRWDGVAWVDVNPNGWGPISASGYLKIDGLQVDTSLYSGSGQPYWVELWANGSLIRSVGNTARGEPEFRIWAGVDNTTPWGCPAP
jgi:hypothetical protein